MTHRKTLLGASTALVTVIAALPQSVAAQTIPPCNDAAEAREASEVPSDDLGGLALDEVPALLDSGAICILPNGSVQVTGSVDTEAAASDDASGDAEATADVDAEAEAGVESGGSAEATESDSGEPADTAADEAAPVQQDSAESAAPPAEENADAEADTQADGGAESEAEADAEADTQADGGAESEAEADAEADAQADGGADSEAETDAEANAQTDGGAGANAEAVAEESVESGAGDGSADGAEADAEANVQAGGDADAPADDAASSVADDAADTVEGLENALTGEGEDAAASPEQAAEEEMPSDTTAETDTAADTETATETETTETPSDEADAAPADTEESPEVAEEAPASPAPDEEQSAEGESDSTTVTGRDRPTDVEALEDAEPVETSETVLTEENTRSSDEDFKDTRAQSAPDAEASGDDDDGGLSSFEKFAIGAAGIAVLSQIIGDDEEVVSNTGDRVVVQRNDGSYYVLKDDDELLRRPGADVRTETFTDGSTRTTVTRENGVQVVTISSADGTVLRRTKVFPDGRSVVLFDDTQTYEPVDVSRLPQPAPEERVRADNASALRAALEAERARDLDRSFSLAQVRNIREVRELMPEINIDAINFATGSAAIRPQEAEDLYELGEAMSQFIEENPDELFLIEGHTDAVGDAAMNLTLSDRRAESVALALTEYFDVPPENMVVQGYGERYLKVPTQDAERANRRAVVRRITPLVQVAAR